MFFGNTPETLLDARDSSASAAAVEKESVLISVPTADVRKELFGRSLRIFNFFMCVMKRLPFTAKRKFLGELSRQESKVDGKGDDKNCC